MAGLVEFFHNIIPGAIFIFLFDYLYDKSSILKFFNINFETSSHFGLRLENNLLLGFIIILSLFVGFLFQAITKIFKDRLFYHHVLYELIEKEPDTFEAAKKQIKNFIKIPSNEILCRLFWQKSASYTWSDEKKDNEIIKNYFFFMNNYISSKYDKGSNVSSHFWNGNAFWSNLAIAFFILGIISIGNSKLLTAGLFLLAILALHTFYEHLKSFFHIVLYTYVGLENLKLGIRKKPKAS